MLTVVNIHSRNPNASWLCCRALLNGTYTYCVNSYTPLTLPAVNIPDRLWDSILLRASPSALRVALALIRHGRPQVDDFGYRTVHLRVTRQALAKLAGVSKRSVDLAVDELADLAVLRVHKSNRANAPDGYSLALDGDANFAPPSQLVRPSHDHDDDDRTPSRRDDLSSSHLSKSGVQLLHRLRTLGVTEPGKFVAEFGEDRCRDGVLYVEAMRPPANNPGGLLRVILQKNQPLRETEPWELLDRDSLDARRERYAAHPPSHQSSTAIRSLSTPSFARE